jgi:hypothetical protein
MAQTNFSYPELISQDSVVLLHVHQRRLITITNEGTSYKHFNILNVNFDTKDLFDYSETGYSSYESVVQSNKFPYMEQLKNIFYEKRNFIFNLI